MLTRFTVSAALILFLFSNPLHATEKNYRLFANLFAEWSAAFNRRDLAKSCDLFSKEVIADYQGIPKKNYKTICDGFKKIFTQFEEQYHYHFKLHEVYVSGSLAAVQITWFLKITENNKVKSFVQDEGIDIFKKDKAGKWKIVNYIAYPSISKEVK